MPSANPRTNDPTLDARPVGIGGHGCWRLWASGGDACLWGTAAVRGCLIGRSLAARDSPLRFPTHAETTKSVPTAGPMRVQVCVPTRAARESRQCKRPFPPIASVPQRHREPPLLCRYAGTCRWVVVTVWRGGPAHTPPQRPAPAAPGVRPFTLGKAPGRVQCGTEVAPEAALAIGLVRCRRKAPERCTGRPSALQRHATGGNHGMADTTKVTRAIYQTS